MAANARARERRISSLDEDDWFPTPAPCTQALLDHEIFTQDIWEPACGDGAMARVIERLPLSRRVHATDLVDRGYGTGGVDFLRADRLPGPGDWSIITNPPFKLAGAFADHALALKPRKLALFVRVSFLEGQKRAAGLFRDNPPARFWVFSRRQTLWKGGDPDARTKGGAMAFAWAVWERGHRGGPVIGWLP
jgi:hypothetical protein